MNRLKGMPHTVYQLIFEYPQTGCAVLVLCTTLGIFIYLSMRSWRKK